MELIREHPLTGQGLLYPMMVIAAVAVIVFSIVGIATITGWMPSAMLSESQSQAVSLTSQPGRSGGSSTATPEDPQTGAAFQCAECGVIESIREIERRSALTGNPLAKAVRRMGAVRSPLL